MTTKIVRSLQGHEDIIESGLRFFVDVGNSLIAIRDEKLYAENHETFEAYCKTRWGFARSHAYRMMDSAEVVNRISKMSPIGGQTEIVIPNNERQARALAEASDDPKTQAKVWMAAVDSAPKDADGNPKITAAGVKKAAELITPKPATPPKEISGGNTFNVEEFGASKPEKEEPIKATTFAEKIKLQNQTVEAFARRLMMEFDSNLPDDPWIDESRTGIARDLLRSVCATIRLAKAHDKPCPKCCGNGCKTCRNCGYMPKNEYLQMGGS